MALKVKTENTNQTFEPEVINDSTKVTFSRVKDASGTTIHGKIEKDNAEVGNISFSDGGGYLIVSLKPFAKLEREEITELCAKAPEWIFDAIDA